MKKIITLSLIISAFTFLTINAFAQPSNDDCTGAISLTPQAACTYLTYDNTGATDSGEPDPGCASYAGGDVWFIITIPASGSVVIDMQTGGITDSGLAAYTGNNCNSLTLVECDDDDSANGNMSNLSLTGLTPGDNLWLQVWEYGGDTFGTFGICVTDGGGGGSCTSPSNETCANAIVVTEAQITAVYSNTGVLGCTDDCVNGAGYFDVFYRYDCTCSGGYTFDMRNSVGDTYMRIYSGSCCGTLVASDDDSYGDMDPEITVTLTAGTSYWIECGSLSSTGFENSAYNFFASTTCGGGGSCTSPTNETCANSIVISDAQITAGYSYTGVLGCTDDCVNGTGYYDVFFRYDCSCTGTYTFDMRDSDGDTYMRLYSGSCCGTQVASDDDSYGGSDPEISVTLTAGTTYWIECAGYSSTAMENSPFNFYASTICGTPCGTINLIDCGTTYSGTLAAAGSDWSSYTGCAWSEPGDEIVYTFTAGISGTYTMSGIVTSGDADFFLMSSCGNTGTNVYGSCWGGGDISVSLTSGTTYYIIVDNYSSSNPAVYSLFVQCPVIPECVVGEPFCTSDAYTFPAATNVASLGDIGCLYSTPNAAWYYMEIADPGSITIDISSGADVDFIAWGPYSDLPDACASIPLTTCSECPNNTSDPTFYPYGQIVDCSYDAAAYETCTIDGALTGEVYVLLITNYANVVTNIDFQQTAGAGSTNCDIVAPPISNNGPLCLGDRLELYVSNPVAGATYAWTGPDGWTSSTMEPFRNNVTLAMAGVYSLVITVGGVSSAPVTTTVEIYTYPTAGITNNTGTTVLTCAVTPINVTATGGGTYAWSGGGSTTTAANSFTAPGTYTVTVTNVVCEDLETITITQNITPPTAGITNNTGTTILTCTTTAISVTATGGGTYAWSGGATPATAANSLTTPGTYTVTVTGANGCTATASITITQNITPPTAAITNNTGTTILTCTTTAISVTATGGGTYAWSGGATPTTAANSLTTPGTYTVTVTGANGCTATASITITQNITPPTAGITNNTGTTILTCTTTAISVTATGGGTYAWSGGATPATAANSLTTPSTYTVTVTGANGCTATASITITQNITPPTAGITNNTGTTILTCTTTAISVTATGGGTYAWSGGATPGTAANSLTTPGTYTVTVTGANGCTATASITITQNITPPTAGITNNTGTTILTCTTTAISVTATGGGTYAWSGGATPATAANSLTTPGTYTVTVTAANGCTATSSITITQNITPPPAAITNNTGTTVLTCTTTAISVTATGGGTYAWSGGATPATAANSLTTPGTYTVTVTGANGCTATASITITQNITPPTAGITNNTGTTILTCTTTAISVTATGGGTYAWSGGATPATAANSLTTPGTYTVTVTGANGCTATASITITQNITPPTAGITNNTGTTVLDCTITSISVTATGGGTYAWSGGATPATAANSLTAPGTYTVTVTGANGCTATASITITQTVAPPPAAITNNTGTTVLTCTTTAISVTATGGVGYLWSGGATPATAANSLTAPGTYTVTVTAANGCTATASITITQNITPPTAGITNNTGTTILTCTTTAISVTATGGGTYAWSGGATPATAANSLTAPGSYTVTVTGANGCTATASITITQDITPPPAAITNNTGTTILTCTTTAISVTATGGGTYAWSGGATPATAANSLTTPGTYTVTVTGANGCTATASITIAQDITPPTAGITNNTGTTILTCTTTAISVTATGGGTYAWSGGATPATAANSLTTPGTYTVTVTGANGCTATASITITQDITPPTAGITNNTGTTILTCTTTAISVTATGGGTYAWSGGATPATAANSLTTPGTYTVTVTGANGCTATASITITQNITPPPAAITNNTGTTILTCNTTAISVTATGGGTYTWSGGATPATAANSLTTPGTYTVTVTGANGCTATASITITQNITPPPAAITNNTGTTIITCSVTSISVTATGGTSYSWSGGTTPLTANNTLTSAGTYVVTVTGANGCTATASITLTDALTITASITAIADQNCSTPGSATVQGASGIGPYTYTWPGTAGGVVGGTASSLAAGTYVVSVYDSNMCSVTQSVTIVDIGGLTGSAVVSATPLCFGGNGGAIDVSVFGGTPNYNINWGSGSFSSPLANYTITGLVQGTYNITVTDVNSCQVIVSATITQPTVLTASSSATAIMCNGGNSTVTVSGSGGTALYSGTGTFTVTAGTHNYTVTDANGCTANTSVTVTQPTVLTASSSATAIMCNGGNSTVTVSGSGGTSPYSGTGTFTVTAGTHNYTVTDANGCTANTSVTVSQPTLLTASSSATAIMCNGGNSTVTVSGSGGTSPYSGTGTFTVTAGTHNYTVTDANGCTANTSVTVTQPTVLTASSSATAIMCNGGNSTVTVSGSGGTAPYSGTGTFTVTAGTHNYTVTDANGCTANTSVTVSQPTLLTASSSATAIMCNGGNSTVTVSGSGGTSPYSGTGTFTVTAGTHNYTVTDANGCTANTSVTVSQPTLLTASSSATAIMCNGGNSTVTVSGAGGTSPYSGTGTFTVTAGTHNYTVTDANGCTANTSVTVTQPTVLTASSSATAIMCNGGNSTVTVSGLGGTAPYSGTGTFTVTAGTHNYTVTDVNGCTANTSVTVSQPTLLTASSSATAIMCNGGNSTVIVSGAGGTSPYSGTGTFTVTAGTHNYTVTDANGCTANTSVTVTQPTLLTASSSATAIMCNGGNSTVTVSGAGGTSPYSGTGTFTVTAGTHNYTVTDANGCTANTSVTVSQPTLLTSSITALTNQVCSTPGSATVAGANGTAPYTYSWPATAGGVSGGTASLLNVGTYIVTVYDANMCSVTQSVIITDIGGLTATATMTGSPLCFGGSEGSINVNIGSGTAPYTVNWGTGSATSPTNIYNITGLAQGLYNITITDVNGCQATTSATVTQPTVLTASSTSGAILCNGGTTTVTVSATGGTPAYSGTGTFTVPAGTHNYTVTDANGCISSTSITIGQPSLLTASSTSGTILCNGGTTTVNVSGSGGTPSYGGIGTFTVTAGTYNYTVTDANGCTATTSITVSQPTPLVAASVAGTISCNGGTTTVNVTASGGTMVYSGTGTFTVLAGTHNYTVTDANGCTSNTSVIVTQPTVLTASSTATAILCNGGTSQVTVTASGGTPTYSGTGNFIVQAGLHNYTVTDQNGCQANTSINITEPTWLTATASGADILCNGGTTVITVTGFGGTTPYSGDGNFTVSAGSYTYTVTDANGCTTFASEIINQPGPIVVSDVVTNALCNGLFGSATVTVVSGGTPSFDIEWQDGSTLMTNNSIPVNTTFSYTVTDANGCQSVGDVYATEPAALQFTVTGTDASCYGICDGIASVTNIVGGTPPYQQTWNTSETTSTITSLCAGTYQVTVIDSNGCEETATVTISQPAQLTLLVSTTPAQCGVTGGSAFAIATGGSAPYNYHWSVAQTGNPIINLEPDLYTGYVDDANGCTAEYDFNVGISGTINATITQISPVSCADNSDGILQASSTNGDTPLLYEWNIPAYTATVSNLSAGTYLVTVTDDWGCKGTDTYVLVNPVAMVLTASITNVKCYGESNGSISTSVAHGTGPYTYVWSPSGVGPTISGLPVGTYIVDVTDDNGCTVSGTYDVTEPAKLELINSVSNISCYGNMDGAVAMSATGGTAPYSYTIYDGVAYGQGASHYSLAGGEYTIAITDDNGCTDSDQIMILEPSEITGTFLASNPSCIGNNDGYIQISVMGGTEPYLFGWNDYFIDIPYIGGLYEGQYEVLVTDANNCVLQMGSTILADVQVDCLKIPNAFTPNGDGPNDTWIIENLEIFPGAYVYVYNRWGQLIYTGRPGDEWDGQYNGTFVPASTYLYVIELHNGAEPYVGTVTVIY